MDSQLNFDAEVLTSEIMQKLSVPITTKKNTTSKPKILSESKLVTNVKVSDLIIDLSYQRKPNQAKVAKIIKDFDPNAIGVIICSIRENGVIAVIDGGHRISALNAMGMSNHDVRCLVFFGLTIAEEAEMFVTLNDNRTKPKTQDIFKSKVAAGDSDAVEINKILSKLNLAISNGPANNSIRAMGTVSNIYKRDGATNLSNTLTTLSVAFGSHSSSFSDSALIAISKIFATFGERVDVARLCVTLSAFGTANLWTGKGSAIAKTMGYKDVNVGMIVCLLNEYNKRLRSGRLDIKDIV